MSTADDTKVWVRDEPDSPCLSICVQHPGAGICIGCYRTPEEVARWAEFSATKRQQLLQELPARGSRLTAAGVRPSALRRKRLQARSQRSE